MVELLNQFDGLVSSCEFSEYTLHLVTPFGGISPYSYILKSNYELYKFFQPCGATKCNGVCHTSEGGNQNFITDKNNARVLSNQFDWLVSTCEFSEYTLHLASPFGE